MKTNFLRQISRVLVFSIFTAGFPVDLRAAVVAGAPAATGVVVASIGTPGATTCTTKTYDYLKDGITACGLTGCMTPLANPNFPSELCTTTTGIDTTDGYAAYAQVTSDLANALAQYYTVSANWENYNTVLSALHIIYTNYLVAGNSAAAQAAQPATKQPATNGAAAGLLSSLPGTEALTFGGSNSGISCNQYSYGDFVPVADTSSEKGSLMSGLIQYFFNTQVDQSGTVIPGNQTSVAMHFAVLLIYSLLSPASQKIVANSSSGDPYNFYNWLYGQFADTTQTTSQLTTYLNTYLYPNPNAATTTPNPSFTPNAVGVNTCPANPNPAAPQYSPAPTFNGTAWGCNYCSTSLWLNSDGTVYQDANGKNYCTAPGTALVFNDPNSSTAGKISYDSVALVQAIAQATAISSSQNQTSVINGLNGYSSQLYNIISHADFTNFSTFFGTTGCGLHALVPATTTASAYYTPSTNTCDFIQYYKIMLYDYIEQGNLYFRCDVDNMVGTPVDTSLYYANNPTAKQIAIETILAADASGNLINSTILGDQIPTTTTSGTADLTLLTNGAPPSAISFNYLLGSFYNFLPSVFQPVDPNTYLIEDKTSGFDGVVTLAGLNNSVAGVAAPSPVNGVGLYSTKLASQSAPNSFWASKCGSTASTLSGSAAYMNTQAATIDILSNLGKADVSVTPVQGAQPSAPTFTGSTIQGASSNLLTAAQYVVTQYPVYNDTTATAAFQFVTLDGQGNSGTKAYPINKGDSNETVAGSNLTFSATTLTGFMPSQTVDNATGAVTDNKAFADDGTNGTNDNMGMISDLIHARGNYATCWANYSSCKAYQSGLPAALNGFFKIIESPIYGFIMGTGMILVMAGIPIVNKLRSMRAASKAAKAAKAAQEANPADNAGKSATVENASASVEAGTVRASGSAIEGNTSLGKVSSTDQLPKVGNKVPEIAPREAGADSEFPGGGKSASTPEPGKGTGTPGDTPGTPGETGGPSGPGSGPSTGPGQQTTPGDGGLTPSNSGSGVTKMSSADINNLNLADANSYTTLQEQYAVNQNAVKAKMSAQKAALEADIAEAGEEGLSEDLKLQIEEYNTAAKNIDPAGEDVPTIPVE